MKRIRALSIAAALLICLSSCTPKEEKVPLSYVTYYNPKRDEVIAATMGEKTSVTPNADNVRLSYSTSGDGAILIYVENGSTSFFYNGTVNLSGGKSEYTVSIKMLAPSSTCSFKIRLTGEVGKFAYSIAGGFYAWPAAAKIDINFEEVSMNAAPNERMLVVDADAITPEVRDKLARRFYIVDTLRNYETDISYFLVTKGNYHADNSAIFDCEMNVDTPRQTVAFKDKMGREIDLKTY